MYIFIYHIIIISYMLNILQLILENIQMNTNTKILHPKIHIVTFTSDITFKAQNHSFCWLCNSGKSRYLCRCFYASESWNSQPCSIFEIRIKLWTDACITFTFIWKCTIFYIDGKFYIMTLHLYGCSRGKLNKLTLNSTSFTITSWHIIQNVHIHIITRVFVYSSW